MNCFRASTPMRAPIGAKMTTRSLDREFTDRTNQSQCISCRAEHVTARRTRILQLILNQVSKLRYRRVVQIKIEEAFNPKGKGDRQYTCRTKLGSQSGRPMIGSLTVRTDRVSWCSLGSRNKQQSQQRNIQKKCLWREGVSDNINGRYHAGNDSLGAGIGISIRVLASMSKQRKSSV